MQRETGGGDGFGGSKEVVLHGETGFIANPFDIGTFMGTWRNCSRTPPAPPPWTPAAAAVGSNTSPSSGTARTSTGSTGPRMVPIPGPGASPGPFQG
ncbi:MAG: hypothetical protein R3E96_13685 [Planctomycetota bacterium]